MYKFQDSAYIMNFKIGIRIMEYDEEFLFYFSFYSFFGKLLKNPEKNFITSLHLITHRQQKPGHEE